MLNTLSGRFLILTAAFVVMAEILIFIPSVARFREDYLLLRVEKAQIASLARLAGTTITDDLQEELLSNAGVYNVVLRRDDARQLILTSPLPLPITETYDLRNVGAVTLIRDAISRLLAPEPEIVRVISEPVQKSGLMIEITLDTAPLRAAMLSYGIRILLLSAGIAIFTAILLFFAVRMLLLLPIKQVVNNIKSYAAAPEDAHNIIQPGTGLSELREAEDALFDMQNQLTSALKQKDRLAQLGAAVAKISHDLRNILTSAQLFTDRIEQRSEDPHVRRLAPKLVNSITRAVNLCENSLTYGRAEEPAPKLVHFHLRDVVQDIIYSEHLAAEATDIHFSKDIPADLIIKADSEQIYRVLQNLVRNARQALLATGNRGEIAVKAWETPDNWMIRVSDSGPGLPAKTQEHLFIAFQGKVAKGGSGLGLAISSELMRNHGGSIELEKTSAKGTSFILTLPR